MATTVTVQCKCGKPTCKVATLRAEAKRYYEEERSKVGIFTPEQVEQKREQLNRIAEGERQREMFASITIMLSLIVGVGLVGFATQTANFTFAIVNPALYVAGCVFLGVASLVFFAWGYPYSVDKKDIKRLEKEIQYNSR